MARWIRLSEAASRFKIPLESLCNLVGLKNIEQHQPDNYWLLMEVSHKTGTRKEAKELQKGNVATRILYVVRTDDIYSEDDPNELLYLFTSLKKLTPLFRQIIMECYLNISHKRSREIFLRLSLGEDIYQLTKETGLTQRELYKRYEAAVNELMENRDKVINNLKFRYQLVEKIYRLEKIYQRLVKNIQKREADQSDFYNKYASDQLLSDTERVRKLSLTFHEIGLQYSLRRLLVDNGIETIPDLLRVLRNCGPGHLLTFKNFGKRSLKTLKERLVFADLIDDNFGSEYYDYID